MKPLLLTLCLLAACAPAFAADWYAATNGTRTGSATLISPLDIRTAATNTARIVGGDTLWLIGGTYTGHVTFTLSAASSNSPIKIRNYANQRVIIDGQEGTTAFNTWTMNTSNVWVLGTGFNFEFSMSNTSRVSSQSGSSPTDVPSNYPLWFAFGDGNRAINLNVHDYPAGIGVWDNASNAVVYGCNFRYVGWSGTDRTHGHGGYFQNQETHRRIENNSFAYNAYAGFQAYGEGDKVKHYLIAGNVSYQNGLLFEDTSGDQNVIIGSTDTPAWDITYRGNQTFHLPGVGDPGTSDTYIGYTGGMSNSLIVSNYDAGVTSRWNLDNDVTITSNEFYGTSFGIVTNDYPANIWRTANPTSGTKTFVTTNDYETGRGRIVAYNWSSNATVTVSLASLRLATNQVYEVHFNMNPQAGFYSNVYNGTSLVITMSGWNMAAPVGSIPTPTNTLPVFGVWDILPGATNSVPAVTNVPPILRIGDCPVTNTVTTNFVVKVQLPPTNLVVTVQSPPTNFIVKVQLPPTNFVVQVTTPPTNFLVYAAGAVACCLTTNRVPTYNRRGRIDGYKTVIVAEKCP